MAKKSGTIHRIASKTVASGRVHLGKVLLAEETLPEGAGGTVEDLLSSSKAKSAPKSATKKGPARTKASAKKKPTIKGSSRPKKSPIR